MNTYLLLSNDGQAQIELVFSYRIHHNGCRLYEENKEVTEKNAPIVKLANYLICLYDNLYDRYASSQVKIEKLLVIAEILDQFKFKKSLLPEDTNYYSATCGIKIPDLEREIRMFISSGIELNSEPEFSSEDIENLNNPSNLFIAGFNPDSINNNVKSILLNVFLRFCSYDAGYLGEQMNELKSGTSITEKSYFNNDGIKEIVMQIKNNNNELATYIKNYDKD